MSNKKRFKKDPLDQNIEFDSDDVTNSEDDYSDTERRLLEKVRKKRTVENFDSEDEVFKLADSNDDDDDDDDMPGKDGDADSMASDIEGLPREDDDLPDERAWGKKKRAYYSTDYVDQDYASASQKDLADAEMEEAEARSIQKRLAEQLDDADFGLDLIEAPVDGARSDDGEEQIVKTDLSKLSKRQKQALMQKESPEFQALVADFKERITEAKTILAPFLKLVEQGRCPDCPAVTFIETKYHLILNYCVNITFYLTLKAKKLSVNSHPIVKRLAQYRQLLGQLENGQGKLLIEVEEILEADRAGKPLYRISDNAELNEKSPSKKNRSKKPVATEKTVTETKATEDESMVDDEEALHSEGDDSDENAAANENEAAVEDIDENYENEKRPITYQIAKNKGLTPHRKKEQRNPRVKHRNKYRKAKIRRKGAVREVRKEIKRYDGEISGIKAGVKKSIKLK